MNIFVWQKLGADRSGKKNKNKNKEGNKKKCINSGVSDGVWKIKWRLNSRAALIIEWRSEDSGALMYRVDGKRRKFGKIMRGNGDFEVWAAAPQGVFVKASHQKSKGVLHFLLHYRSATFHWQRNRTTYLRRWLHVYKM